jgi:hypothetical protein
MPASALTHSLRSCGCALALLLVHRFYQTPAVASVWTDALDSFVFAAFFPKPGTPLLETPLSVQAAKPIC